MWALQSQIPAWLLQPRKGAEVDKPLEEITKPISITLGGEKPYCYAQIAVKTQICTIHGWNLYVRIQVKNHEAHAYYISLILSTHNH